MSFSSNFDPNAVIRTASRLPQRPKLSNAEVKRRAETYLIAPPSAELLKAYRFTATGGVVGLMHYRQLLNLAPRTIRKYTELGLLERLPDRTPKLRKLGLTHSTADLRLYTLGPIGHAMAEMENITAPSGYHALVDRVTHDFLATHMVVTLLHRAQQQKYEWQWHNRYQARIDFTYHKSGVEPDAAIMLSHPTKRSKTVYLLEFHNEDHGLRVPEKLLKYWTCGEWEIKDLSPWWGVSAPVLLVASPTFAPLFGYTNAYKYPDMYTQTIGKTGYGGEKFYPTNPIYGITLKQLAQHPDPAVWRDLRFGHYVDVINREKVQRPIT